MGRQTGRVLSVLWYPVAAVSSALRLTANIGGLIVVDAGSAAVRAFLSAGGLARSLERRRLLRAAGGARPENSAILARNVLLFFLDLPG